MDRPDGAGTDVRRRAFCLGLAAAPLLAALPLGAEAASVVEDREALAAAAVFALWV